MQNDDARKKAIGSHFSGLMCVGKQRDGRSLAHDEECGALHRGVQARYTNMYHGTASEVSNMVKFSVKRFWEAPHLYLSLLAQGWDRRGAPALLHA